MEADRVAETINPSINCIDLLQASAEELSEFQERIKPFNGTLNVLIHPFFAPPGYVEPTYQPDQIHLSVSKAYGEKRDAFVKNSLHKQVPLVIFQPGNNYDDLPTELSKYGEGTVYTVKTEDTTHAPLGGPEAWEKLTATLKNAGVTRIILSGMYLSSYKTEYARSYSFRATQEFVKKRPAYIEKFPHAASWLQKDIVLFGCAGNAAVHFLESGIDVSLSSITTPSSGHGYNKVVREILRDGEDP